MPSVVIGSILSSFIVITVMITMKTLASFVAAFECSTPHALQPHPYNCKLFIHCVWGVPVVKECPGILHFNPTLNVCDWPPNVACGPVLSVYSIYRRPARK